MALPPTAHATWSGSGASAFSGAAPSAVAAPARWLLLVGDSKTAPNTTHPEFGSDQGWQPLLIASLAAALGGPYQYYNVGLGSQSVGSYLATISTRMASALDTGTTPGATVAAPGTTMPPAGTGPAAVLLNLGVNDSLLTAITPFPAFPAGSTDAAGWQANYLAIVDYVRTRWASSPIYCMRWWSRLATAGHDTTEAGWIDTAITLRPNCFLGPDERVVLKGSDNGATNTYDGIHMGTAGHLAVAAAWKAVLWP